MVLPRQRATCSGTFTLLHHVVVAETKAVLLADSVALTRPRLNASTLDPDLYVPIRPQANFTVAISAADRPAMVAVHATRIHTSVNLIAAADDRQRTHRAR